MVLVLVLVLVVVVIVLGTVLVYFCSLVEETQDLTTGLFTAGLLVRHDAVRCGDDDVTELTTGQQVDDPLFDLSIFYIKSGADYAALVQPSCKLNDNLVGSVVINNLELPNVSCAVID